MRDTTGGIRFLKNEGKRAYGKDFSREDLGRSRGRERAR